MDRYIFLLLTFLSLEGVGQQGAKHQIKVQSSKFNIEGQTNVGPFECGLYQSVSKDMIRVESWWENFQLSFDGLEFRYPVESFSCKIKPMNKDLQELLRSDNYPFLFLEIHSIEVDRANKEIEQLDVGANVSITLSGVKRQYKITNGKIINRSEEDLVFVGQKILKLTDFGLEPPTKFLGLVQVTDELKVDFRIDMHVETYENREAAQSKAASHN